MTPVGVPVLPVGYADKVVLVTGASRGIGRVLVKGFAAAGARTMFVARREAELKDLEHEIAGAGHEGRAFAADLAKPAEVDAMLDAMMREFGGVDVLVNNVGIPGPTAPIEETPLEGWNETIAVNLTSAFLAIRGVVPAMRRRGGGAIVNIGSVNGKTPFAQRSSYAATKMGMIGMTRTLALELGPSGIRVNCILPANVAGERVDEVFAAQAKARGITVDEAKQQVLALSPLHTQVAPESVLNVALFLASDHARHMTGQDVNVTAGMIMY
ncbi:SDR family NAD(P)-dependent oxidoreductase [Amycolatopsis pithecellobii]|uniref:SDR family NAD(P)-dependent oxidoreductase n=1 Tax=Amycolatopsis pithecellobii TaxID=664692 RepID=UPI001407495C|nr:SDR family NAD(P)-dependent oxidoreductase [Amycolatopsis pithecellobii]